MENTHLREQLQVRHQILTLFRAAGLLVYLLPKVLRALVTRKGCCLITCDKAFMYHMYNING